LIVHKGPPGWKNLITLLIISEIISKVKGSLLYLLSKQKVIYLKQNVGEK